MTEPTDPSATPSDPTPPEAPDQRGFPVAVSYAASFSFRSATIGHWLS